MGVGGNPANACCVLRRSSPIPDTTSGDTTGTCGHYMTVTWHDHLLPLTMLCQSVHTLESVHLVQDAVEVIHSEAKRGKVSEHLLCRAAVHLLTSSSKGSHIVDTIVHITWVRERANCVSNLTAWGRELAGGWGGRRSHMYMWLQLHWVDFDPLAYLGHMLWGPSSCGHLLPQCWAPYACGGHTDHEYHQTRAFTHLQSCLTTRAGSSLIFLAGITSKLSYDQSEDLDHGVDKN